MGDDARGDIEAEFEVDVEGDVDDAVLEGDALRVWLDNDEDVQVRVGSRVAAGLGAEETEVQQVPPKFWRVRSAKRSSARFLIEALATSVV
jgi:hypothetical protein